METFFFSYLLKRPKCYHVPKTKMLCRRINEKHPAAMWQVIEINSRKKCDRIILSAAHNLLEDIFFKHATQWQSPQIYFRMIFFFCLFQFNSERKHSGSDCLVQFLLCVVWVLCEIFIGMIHRLNDSSSENFHLISTIEKWRKILTKKRQNGKRKRKKEKKKEKERKLKRKKRKIKKKKS